MKLLPRIGYVMIFVLALILLMIVGLGYVAWKGLGDAAFSIANANRRARGTS